MVTILVLQRIHPITQKSWSGCSGFGPLHQHFWIAPFVGVTTEGLYQRAFLSSTKAHWGWGWMCPCSSGKGHHQPPPTPVRYLRGGRWRGTASWSPHLLKLYPDFCKCFDDDSDKYILKENHKPRLLKTGNEETEGNRKQTRDLQKQPENTDFIRTSFCGTFTSQARKKMSVMK